MQIPYAAVITNKVSGERLTVEVTGGLEDGFFDAQIRGCFDSNRMRGDEWLIDPIIAVPAGLGAVVEGGKGTRWVLADPEDDGEIGEWCSRVDGGVEWAHNSSISKFLRDGGRVLSEGVK